MQQTESPYVLEDGELKVAELPVTLTASAVFYAGVQTKKLEFEYDANGLRTQKKEVLPGNRSITTDYTLNGKQITHLCRTESDNNGNATTTDTMHFFYDAQGRPAKLLHNGKMYTYMHNLQGDIVAILDTAGTMVVQYKYDAWGKPLSSIGDLAGTLGVRNPFRYRGYVFDVETQLYYVVSRYYSVSFLRFISADEVAYLGADGDILSYGCYCYCHNDPLNFLDANGNARFEIHTFWKVAFTAIAIGACAVAAGVVGTAAAVSIATSAVASACVSVSTTVLSNAMLGQETTWTDVGVAATQGVVGVVFGPAAPAISFGVDIVANYYFYEKDLGDSLVCAVVGAGYGMIPMSDVGGDLWVRSSDGWIMQTSNLDPLGYILDGEIAFVPNHVFNWFMAEDTHSKKYPNARKLRSPKRRQCTMAGSSQSVTHCIR